MTRRKAYDTNQGKGPSMWRSLEDKALAPDKLKKLAETEQHGGFVGDLLSAGSLVKANTMVSRRAMLKGSSIAALAASLQGCLRRPESIIYPYSDAPENLIPGIPSHFASVTARGRDALGVVVTSHDGRPTKIEGNPAQRRSLGATDVRGQIYVWDLYDPDRSKTPAQRNGNALSDVSQEQFDDALEGLLKKHEADKGAGLRFLAPISNSPSFARMRTSVLARFPKATFHTYSAIDDDNARQGATLAFGEPISIVPNYQNTRVIVSLASDFLGTEPGSVSSASSFAAARAIKSPDTPMSRLYVLESGFSTTGSMADHRRRIRQADVPAFTQALVTRLAGQGVKALQPLVEAMPAGAANTTVDAAFVNALADDLIANKGASIVVAGQSQPPLVHALSYAINEALGANKNAQTVFPAAEPDAPSSRESIAELAASAAATSTLIMIGGNPVYDAPADLKFADLLGREGLTSVHVASHRNETSERSSWHAPLAHELESWGDQRALDASISVQQPLIAPLYNAKSAIETLAMIAGEKELAGDQIVRATQQEILGKRTEGLAQLGLAANATGAAQTWRGALHAGVFIQPQAIRDGAPTVRVADIASAVAKAPTSKPAVAGEFEVSFVPDIALWDGEHANNLWALELPSPMTKLVWDNAAVMSPATRDALGVENGQMIRLSKGDASVDLPVWPLPGHADGCITLALGWGRTAAGRYGNGKGVDVYPLRSSDGMDFADGVKVEVLSETYNLVQTQTHDRMEGRPIAIDATLDEYKKEPEFASYRAVDPVSTPPLWKQVDYSEGYKWGMTIDLASCTGCNACVVACQSENTIPSVGKIEVERGREMHWLRIDRYFVGDNADEPEVAVQPVGCQQCEEAPCENVCPVNATVHSSEGLNDMVYNRCVGTRYCANNCPYKVRRFNYLEWHSHLDDKYAWYGDLPESRKLQFNPNVTVRMRGVMEKCTYCTQRIQKAKIAAKNEHRTVRDGEIKTACQQACPSRAITFGNLNDPEAAVTLNSKLNRQYKLLSEIGTRPRTTYLARIRNPNPALDGKAG